MTLRMKACLDTVWNSQIIKIFSGLAGILTRKLSSVELKTPQWSLFARPYLSSPSLVSRKSRTLRKRVAPAFWWYQERRKPTSGARLTVRINTEKNKENELKIWCVFPPRQPSLCADSFRLAVIWSTSPGALERLQLQLRDATFGSPMASPVWPESSPEKYEKTTPTPQLPGAITLPSELQFVQTLYRWKVHFAIFPTVCYMTHFEHQKASKIALENRERKQYVRKNRGGFGRRIR